MAVTFCTVQDALKGIHSMILCIDLTLARTEVNLALMYHISYHAINLNERSC